jgi:hypothetical protein
MMKGIITGVGALLTWTIILGAGVQIFVWLVIIPSGGHLGYYSSTGGHFGCYPFGRPSWLLS